MRKLLLTAVAVCSAGHSFRGGDNGGNIGAGTDVGTDSDATTAGVWIPIKPAPNTVFYFNPVRGVSLSRLPRGAVTTLAVQTNHGAHSEPEELEPGATVVPMDKRMSCVPHCAWNCTNPICEQDCKPDCPVPQCETRCPKLGTPEAFKGCKVNCGEPNCAMFCPDDPCQGKKTLDCETPKCSTRCDEPKCTMDCSMVSDSGMGCQTVCPDPICNWNCKKPVECPHPECHMVCETPPNCLSDAKHIAVPPPQDGFETVGAKTARREQAKWDLGEWSACSTTCGVGKQTRSAECSSGHDKDCPSQPETTRSCEVYSGCEYHTGDWGDCSSRCSAGTQTRDVKCAGAHCAGEKPVSSKACVGSDEACDQCKMTVWGGHDFSGWERTFPVGNYSAAELEYLGVKCDDISSLEVLGPDCEAHTFEYGDFNQLHGGWDAKFQEGKYGREDIVSHGAKNNDISSFKVYWLNRGVGGMQRRSNGSDHSHDSHDSRGHQNGDWGGSSRSDQIPFQHPATRSIASRILVLVPGFVVLVQAM
mmetsp:Transcript_2752/g.6262  ORF Transcript_2752/g.6262 Transcript_2752/m.6262 type:complete len:531 (+) Transcript_2752:79-1671(+)